MEYKWLNKNKTNNKIIVFFNGWGMDESVVCRLDCEDYDVLMFYDYNKINTTFDFASLNNYRRKYLVAWSMGVMTASLFNINYDSKTAVNGTLFPINDSFGIPKRIYNLTLRNFSPNGAKLFIENMFKEECNFPTPKRDFENQKSELAALTTYQARQDFKYTKVFISSDDKIIPTKNQIAYWGVEPNIESGHCPFNNFSKWSELL